MQILMTIFISHVNQNLILFSQTRIIFFSNDNYDGEITILIKKSVFCKLPTLFVFSVLLQNLFEMHLFF